MYWQVQPLNDDRFTVNNFADQPMWLIRQAINYLEQQQNLNQWAAARQTMTLWNIHKDPKKTPEPFNDIAEFLPHPNVWRQNTLVRKLNIDRQTAILFLQTYEQFGSEIILAFEDWLPEIKMIASGH